MWYRTSTPFGVPKKAGAEAGSAETRLRLKHPRFPLWCLIFWEPHEEGH